MVDRLKEQDFYVTDLIAGGNPENTERFVNLKAELYFEAKKLFEEDKLKIIGNQQLIDELVAIEADYTSDGKLWIVDPRKSPDFADSLVYALTPKPTFHFDFPIY